MMTIVNIQEYTVLKRYAEGQMSWREAARDLRLWGLEDVEAKRKAHGLEMALADDDEVQQCVRFLRA